MILSSSIYWVYPITNIKCPMSNNMSIVRTRQKLGCEVRPRYAMHQSSMEDEYEYELARFTNFKDLTRSTGVLPF